MSAPICPECHNPAEPYRDARGNHIAIDPSGARHTHHKQLAYYCRTCDRMVYAQEPRPVADHDDQQKRAAGDAW